MLRTGIPEFILPRKILDAEIDAIRKLGVEIRTNEEIDKERFQSLRKEFDAIFIAVGLHEGRILRIPGYDLDGVLDSISFLRDFNLGKGVKVGKKVIVIGGGGVAIDVARIVRRLGADVKCCCIEARDELPAHPWDVEFAEEEGVEICCSLSSKRILGEGKVSGIEFARVKSWEFDADGRLKLELVEKSEHILECDTVIFAIGAGANLSFLEGSGVEFKRGIKVKDKNTFETSLEGVFAGGDIVLGPASVIEAIDSGNKAGRAIDEYLRTGKITKVEEEKVEEPHPAKEEAKRKLERGEVELKPRQPMRMLAPAERIRSFDEVELGYTEEEAIQEAKRCLECGVCSRCEECVRICEAGALLHDQKEWELQLDVGAIIVATGVENIDASTKQEYGYGVYPNVISSIQFERILSASGPFGGKILRPSDGKTPGRIAFIQCVGSRDDRTNQYCSAVCCMYSLKEAIIAKEHVAEIEPHIFFMDIRAYGKEFDEYYEGAKKHGVRFTRCRVSSVEEVSDTGNLIVRYVENGEPREEEFELVVLAVGLCAPKEVVDLAEKLGVSLNEYNFCSTDTFSPLDTSIPGIFVSGAFASPKDIPDTVAQASGAAARAASLIWTERGKLVETKEYPPEKDVSGAAPKIGVFVCNCGINIGGIVNVPEVTEYARTLPDVVHAEHNLYTCSQDTQRRIKEIIREHDLNRVVVASCTPRTHESLFQNTIREAGLNAYLFELASIREYCSWVHSYSPVEATEKAKDLVRMAVAKVREAEPLKKFMLDVTPSALIIGGGLSGMTAALSLAEQGFETHLVEKEAELGGNLRHLYYLLESDESPQEKLRSLVEKVSQNDRIKVYTSTKVKSIEGYVGNFKTVLATSSAEEKEIEIQHGVVIVAVGGTEYKPTEYLYGKDERVITQRELEQMLTTGTLRATSVVMIQCVGSRNEDRGCSRVCCAEAVKNALKIKSMFPNVNIYVLYRDVRTYGFRENFYRKAAEMGITFIRYDDESKPEITASEKSLRVSMTEPVLSRKISIDADLVVLSAAILPHPDSEELAKMLKIPLSKEGFFLEAHMKLRPVDFMADGIFLCGLAHGPKFIDESISQSLGASARAVTILSKPKLETEAILADVSERWCVGCEACVSVCPYQARTIDEERKVAVVNEALCQGCGACAVVCPSGSSKLRGYKERQVFSMIDSAV